jgi:RNA polymerase sigma-70 factor (ECF subfamily)
VLDRALALHGRRAYVVQAAIASLHADEPRDWAEIAALYGELARLTDSPVVELTRAVAVAEEQGPQAGLDIVDLQGCGTWTAAAAGGLRRDEPVG